MKKFILTLLLASVGAVQLDSSNHPAQQITDMKHQHNHKQKSEIEIKFEIAENNKKMKELQKK